MVTGLSPCAASRSRNGQRRCGPRRQTVKDRKHATSSGRGEGLADHCFCFFRAAAGRTHQRRNWAWLNPGFDASILDSESGVEQAVPIANRLVHDRVRRSAAGGAQPRTIFISVARQDAAMGAALEGLLRSRGIEGLLDESEIVPDQLMSYHARRSPAHS
jgi:hypothetical protein